MSRERHDATVGDDAMTFGIHAYKSGAFYLDAAINGLDNGTARVIQHSLAMRMGNVELRHHKLGDSETESPERSFPGAGPASRMAGRSCYGNPDEGLRAVRLQAVGSSRGLDGTISKWEAIVTLYDASEAGAALPSVAVTGQDAVIIAEPEVRLQPGQEAKDQDSSDG